MAERLVACNLCEASCGLRVDVDGHHVSGVRGDPDDPHSRGHLCPKAVGLAQLLADPDRVRHPLIREGERFRRATWDEALDRAAAPLRELRARHGADAVAIYVGNPVVHAHGSALASQLLTMAIGSKNRFDPNSQDSNPRTFACMQVYGDPLAMPVPDLDRTDFLLILGANPVVSKGSMMVAGDVEGRLAAIRARGGAIVVVDPRRTETAKIASEHHFIRPGGDAALLLAILHVVFGEALVSAPHGDRLAELRGAVAAFPPERVAPAIGMTAPVIRSLARRLATARTGCVYARVGVCQNEFGPVASWLVEVTNVVTGRLGAIGGAMFPTPAADVATLGRILIGNRWGRWRSRVRGLPEYLGALPSATIAEEIETPGPGQIKALVVIAGNPVMSTPAGERLGRLLPRLEHVVAIDYYLNETTRHAHVLLPPRHVFETGNFELILHRFGVRNGARYSPAILATPDDTRADWEIATELALRLRAPRRAHHFARRLARDLPDRIVDTLLRLGPYRLSLAALRAQPHGVDLGPLVPGVRIRRGRANLAPGVFLADLPRLGAWIDARAAALVLIGRRDLRSNNSWMHNLAALAKGPDRATLHVHPDDATRLGLVDGGRARVRSSAGELEAPVVVTAEVMPGVVSFPHGFGHQAAARTLAIAAALPGASANAITDARRVEPILGTS
ncbi:MAG: molybdopterin-dependent oxidoreductase, partial [Kofleriaceae bacterium]